MKKFILISMMILLMMALCGCKFANATPYVEIHPNDYNQDTVYLPLRDGYQFLKNGFYIQDTEDGYDIIIHCVKENS